MSDRIRCACRRCTIRSVMGPAVIITVGLLFLLDQMRGGFLSFSNTFPIILIVIGVRESRLGARPDGRPILTGSFPPVPLRARPALPQSLPQNPFPGPGQGQ